MLDGSDKAALAFFPALLGARYMKRGKGGKQPARKVWQADFVNGTSGDTDVDPNRDFSVRIDAPDPVHRPNRPFRSHARPMQSHQFATTAAALLFVLGMACFADADERRSITQEKLDCLIEASATLKIGAPVPGLIRNVLVDRGDIVKQGQRLAELENDVEDAAVAAARSRAENDNPVSSGRARVEFLHRKFKRMETLRVNNTVTEAAYDEAKTDERVAILALKEAELNLDIAKSELRRAEGLLRQRVILSPLDAIVTERVLGPGEYRTEQAHIFVLARMNPLYVEVFVPLALFGQVRPACWRRSSRRPLSADATARR